MSESKPAKATPWLESVLNALFAVRASVATLQEDLSAGGTRWATSHHSLQAEMQRLRNAMDRAESHLSKDVAEVEIVSLVDQVRATQPLKDTDAIVLTSVCGALRSILEPVDFDALAQRLRVTGPSLMTFKDAADMLDVQVPRVSKLVTDGRLMALGVGKDRRVTRASVYDERARRNELEDQKELRKRN